MERTVHFFHTIFHMPAKPGHMVEAGLITVALVPAIPAWLTGFLVHLIAWPYWFGLYYMIVALIAAIRFLQILHKEAPRFIARLRRQLGK